MKEALETIEDLKDIFTEKSSLIKEIGKRKQKLEKEVRETCEMGVIAHIADIYKECKEVQTPFAVT